MKKYVISLDYLAVEHGYNNLCPLSQKPVQSNAFIQFQGVFIGFSHIDFRAKFAQNPEDYPEILTLISEAHSKMKTGEYQPRMRWFGRRMGAKFSSEDKRLVNKVLPLLEVSQEYLNKDSIFKKEELFPENPHGELWLEIGFGGGEHLIHQAKNNPHVNFIGCEPFLTGVASLLRQIEEHDLKNIRIFSDDARLLMDCLEMRSLSRIYVLFADPWPKKRHQRRRFITHENLDLMAELLAKDGVLYFASDHIDYIPWAVGQIVSHSKFQWRAEKPEDWLCAPYDHTITRYQQKAMEQGDICRFIQATLSF